MVEPSVDEAAACMLEDITWLSISMNFECSAIGETGNGEDQREERGISTWTNGIKGGETRDKVSAGGQNRKKIYEE